MSRVSNIGVDSPRTSGAESKPETDFGNVDLDQFLQLMITELQNQDPLNPLDNSQLVQQLGQIREIGATNQLSNTLNTFLDGQTLTTASSMIGKQVVALTDAGEELQGVVERVSIEPDKNSDARNLRVFVAGQSLDPRNIRQIVNPQPTETLGG